MLKLSVSFNATPENLLAIMVNYKMVHLDRFVDTFYSNVTTEK